MNADKAAYFMRHAARLARQGRGPTAPNPCVGAVLVRGGEIVAEGWHQRYGEPHAEPNCLADARARGIDPADCAMFVTLEPCNHQGKTPPCSKAVLEAGVKEIFIGTLDPNPKAEGGAQFLRTGGVTVHEGIEETLCRDLTADFRTWQFSKRPYVYLKMAATLDGRIATRTGHSRWISGEESRRAVHELRARCGAVVVGGGTLRADDPRLNVRGFDGAQDPLAVVVTSSLPADPDVFFLTRERAGETIFWTTETAAETAEAEVLRQRGCRIWPLASQGSALDLGAGLERLREECKVWYVLCEGGGGLALSFIEAGIMDEFRLYTAPKIIGDHEAKSLFTGREPQTMDQALNLRLTETRPSGEDMLAIYRPLEGF